MRALPCAGRFCLVRKNQAAVVSKIELGVAKRRSTEHQIFRWRQQVASMLGCGSVRVDMGKAVQEPACVSVTASGRAQTSQEASDQIALNEDCGQSLGSQGLRLEVTQRSVY